jgi:plasmid stabilization system protein ParE
MRMSDASRTTGKSPHAFMREALHAQSRLREDRSALILAALGSEAATLESRVGYAACDVERYFAQRAAGVPTVRPQPRALAAVTYSARAFEHLERIYQQLDADDPTLAANCVGAIAASLRDLGSRPLGGRPAEEGFRERTISRGRTGYIALYRHLELDACVLVVAISHRYAAGYPRSD